MPNFNLFSNERNSQGGGVCIYANKRYSVQLIPEATVMLATIETIFARSNLNGISYVVGCVYRPLTRLLRIFLKIMKK